jgi:hypothetical protein
VFSPSDPMKIVLRLALGFVAFGGFYAAHAQILLTDDFSSSTLNSANWIASTPLPGAVVGVSDALVLTNNGEVLTKSGFPIQCQIDMIFQFTGTQHDSFKIDTRTNGALFLTSG